MSSSPRSAGTATLQALIALALILSLAPVAGVAQELRRLPVHWASIRSARFSRFARRLATSGRGSGRVIAWDVGSGRAIASWICPERYITVVISDDGNRVLAVGRKNNYVYEVTEGTSSAPVTIERARASLAVALSPDGRRVFTLDTRTKGEEVACTITSYSSESGALENRMDMEVASAPTYASFSHDSQQFVVLTRRGATLLSTRTFRRKDFPELAGYQTLARRFDGRTLTVRQALDVRSFNTITRRFDDVVRARESPPISRGSRPRLSPVGRAVAYIATQTPGFVIQRIDAPEEQEAVRPYGKGNGGLRGSPLLDVAWSRDGRQLWLARGDGNVITYDVATRALAVRLMVTANSSRIRRVWDVGPGVVASSSGRDFAVVDHANDRVIWRYPSRGTPVAIGVSRDEAWIYRGGPIASGLTIYDMKTGRHVEDLQPGRPVRGIEISPNGSTVAMLHEKAKAEVSWSGEVSIWNCRKRTRRFTTRTPGPPHWISFSATASWIAVSCGLHDEDRRQSLLLLDGTTGDVKARIKLPRGSNRVGRTDFADDGLILSYSRYSSIGGPKQFFRTWSITNATLVHEFPLFDTRFAVPRGDGELCVLEGSSPLEDTSRKTGWRLWLVELPSRKVRWKSASAETRRPTAAAWSADGRRVLLGFETGELGVLELGAGSAESEP